MKKKGYEIKMAKKDGKWTIDTSSKNYDLKDMARTFRGGIDTRWKGRVLTRTFFVAIVQKRKR